MSVLNLKVQLRKSYKTIRDEFLASGPNLTALNSKISSNILKIVGSESSVWGSYLPRGSEANPQVEVSHITWAYPKVVGNFLEFVIPLSNNSNQEWQINEFQIREPREGQKIEVAQLKGILIPGIAFDRKGHRLGSGKGFFDRTIDTYNGKKVGVAYSVQISATDLPFETHDVPVDVIVTEKEIIQVSERKAS